MELTLFYILAFLSVVSSLLVLSFRNTLSSALALVITLLSVSALFALLRASFLAVMQVLVYAGAIMVLFLFVIMLMDLGREQLLKIKMSFLSVVGILFGGYLGILFVLNFRSLGGIFGTQAEDYGHLRQVGKSLLMDSLVPFEIISLLLLVSIVGVVVLTRKEKV